MLHVTNGDVAAALIRESGVKGDILPWRDVLHEGPVPDAVSAAELRSIRARYLATLSRIDSAKIERGLAQRDAALDHLVEHQEVVLWFEHDLYDQLQLIQVLDRLAGLQPGRTRLSLICIGSHPAVDRFEGLGQLSPAQMAELFDLRAPLRAEQIELGRRAWEVFCSPDPRRIEELLGEDTSELPFLAGALRRHLEQFPSARNGLGRTEQVVLDVLCAEGDASAASLFRAQAEREERPFLGDTTFWAYLRRLAAGRAPGVAIGSRGGASFADASLHITDIGRRVAARSADYVALNGIDRWWGGVHQVGYSADWRWDPITRRLQASGD